jgi:hypothetical protein
MNDLLFPVHPIIIWFLLISVVDVRNEYYVPVDCDECYQTLHRCICNVAFMSFILVDRDETGSDTYGEMDIGDPGFCPISCILSHIFSWISEADTNTLELDIYPIYISEIEFKVYRFWYGKDIK